jgi:AraC family transcriptional regulator
VACSQVTLPGGAGSYLKVRRQDIAKLALVEDLYSTAAIDPKHSHKRAYFKIVLKGAITEHEKHRTLEHRALSVGFQPIDEPHSSHIHPEGLHYLKVLMNPEWMERIGDGLDRPHFHCLNSAANFANGTLPWMGMRLYDEWQRMDAVASLTIEGIVLEMIAETIRCRTTLLERKPPRWLKEAEDLLHTEFAETLTLEYIAETVGVHPVYLARVFRQQRHCTIGDYVRRLRIEHACKEIASSDIPLADIALAAGFADQSHFSKVFKRLVGLSPAAFRTHCSASSRIVKIQVNPEP